MKTLCFFVALAIVPASYGAPLFVGPGPSVLEIDDTAGVLGNNGLTLNGPSTARGYGGLSALTDTAVTVNFGGMSRITPWTYDGVSWSALFNGGELFVTELATPANIVLDATLNLSVIDVITGTTNGALLSILSGTVNGGYTSPAFSDALFVSVLMASLGGPFTVEQCQLLEESILGKINIGGDSPGNHAVPEPWQFWLTGLALAGIWFKRRRSIARVNA